MSFLTFTPDLTGSVFTVADLEEARRLMAVVFERYAPEWPSSPVGVLAGLWNQNARPATATLIDLAKTLFYLSSAITPESTFAFGEKMRQLLHCRDKDQYEELLAELRVGAILAVRAGPIACEPLARPPAEGRTNPPKSPDFAIRLPGSDILIEVTTLRIRALDTWERAIEVIREKVREAAVRAALAKEVEIHAPLGLRADALTRNRLDRLITSMKSSPNGRIEMSLGKATAKFIWRDIPVIKLPPDPARSRPSANIFPSSENFSAVMSSGGLGIQSAFASKVVPVLGPSVEELFVKSMRNTIDGKRSQFSMSAPSLLILQPGNWRFAPDYIQYLIEKRIWPNAKYAWLTGIGILKPRRTFNKGDAPTNLTVTWNTQPTEPRTEALEALIERNAWFSKGLHIESPSDA